MEMINRAFFRALSLEIVSCVIMVALVILCIFESRKKDSMAIFAFAIGIFMLVECAISVVPLVKDYISKDVIQVEATYINALGDKSKSPSAIMGIHSVILETDEGKLSLTTVPFSSDVFPTGEYTVTAWYAKNSKSLLYIEIHSFER